MPAIWAILVPTLVWRRRYLARLMERLRPQADERVAIYTLEDEGAETTGRKRQRLIETVEEKYVSFVDDDDLVSEDFCPAILEALEQDPDVVGFRVRYYEDGRPRGSSLHSVQAKTWHTERHTDGTAQHYRTPNHLNPVRREMALAAGFPSQDVGEDAAYSIKLFRKYPKMREVFIDREIYYYLYRHPRNRAEGEYLPVKDKIDV
jgi:alkylated DNA repair dioxygenase AlkB